MSDETPKHKIVNRIQDCGEGRHVGWWSVDETLDELRLYIEVKPGIVVIACCEGPGADKRVYFYADHEKAKSILR